MKELKPIAGKVIVSMENEDIWLLENEVDNQSIFELIYLNFQEVIAWPIIQSTDFHVVSSLINGIKESAEVAEQYNLSFELTSQCVSVDDFATSCSH